MRIPLGLNILFLLPIFTNLAAAINIPPLQSLHTTSGLELLLPTNQSLLSTLSSSRTPKLECPGQAPYKFINRASCMEAANRLLDNIPISPGQRVVIFKDRGNKGGARSADVILPYLSLSSDGACAIELNSVSLYGDTATKTDVRIAAQALIGFCTPAGSGQVREGSASNIGKDGDISLTLKAFNRANIVCAGKSEPDALDCMEALEVMPVGYEYKSFGIRGRQQQVDVEVPFTFQPYVGAQCRVVVNSAGQPDSEEWYKIWRQAAAIERLCVERGKPGIAYGMGVNRQLDVEITY